MSNGSSGGVDLGTVLALLLAMLALALAIVALNDDKCCASGGDDPRVDQIWSYLDTGGQLQAYTKQVNDFLHQAHTHFHERSETKFSSEENSMSRSRTSATIGPREARNRRAATTSPT